MIFNTSSRFKSTFSAAELKTKLVGKHVKIHNLDFEIYEKEGIVKIIPHAEQIDAIKSLPITHVEFADKKGTGTDVRVSSKMRRIDSGGPTLVAVFSTFMMAAGILFWVYGKGNMLNFSVTLFAIGIIIFIILMVRLQAGYYDYIRKVRHYVKGLAGAS